MAWTLRPPEVEGLQFSRCVDVGVSDPPGVERERGRGRAYHLELVGDLTRIRSSRPFASLTVPVQRITFFRVERREDLVHSPPWRRPSWERKSDHPRAVPEGAQS